MKKILFTIIICLTLVSPALATDVMLEKIYVVDLSKDEIYNRCLQWMAENFADYKDVIQYKDKEQGKIIGKGETFYNVHFLIMSQAIHCKYTMVIDVKNQKYRVQFKDYIALLDNETKAIDLVADIKKYPMHKDGITQVNKELSSYAEALNLSIQQYDNTTITDF